MVCLRCELRGVYHHGSVNDALDLGSRQLLIFQDDGAEGSRSDDEISDSLFPRLVISLSHVSLGNLPGIGRASSSLSSSVSEEAGTASNGSSGATGTLQSGI